MLNLFQPFFYIIYLLTLTIVLLITPIKGRTTNYLLNCGASTTTADNRTWYTDEDTTLAPLKSFKDATKVAHVTNKDPTYSGKPPYTGARIFSSPFTYSFPISPGPKFVRLYFYTSPIYDNTSVENFFLTLTIDGGNGSFTLLRNFSAYLHQQFFKNSFPDPLIAKEFLVMATSSRLNLTFSPTLPAPLAFVNGIEIVAVPDDLYNYLSPTASSETSSSKRSSPLAGCVSAKTYVDNNQLSFTISGPRALETVARLNVGGEDISSDTVHTDSGGLSRTWYKDETYLVGDFTGAIPDPYKTPIANISYTIVPEYTAPSIVYWTARVMGPHSNSFKLKNNLTWGFEVDLGFDYLIRLHFCEIDPSVTKDSQREFEVLVNNEEADDEVDAMYLAKDSRSTPTCKDYVTSIYGTNLSITLRPDTTKSLMYHDVILNGLEIFKMSNQSDGNLAGPNPTLLIDPNRPNKPTSLPRGGRSSSHHLVKILVGLLGSVVLIALVIALAFCWLMRQPTQNDCKRLLPSSSDGSSLPSYLCHSFTLQEIKVATNNFDENFVIGVGGFGKVYKGSIAINGGTEVMVAIKRLNPSSKQGAHEFHTEIVMLTTLRHVHLVSLIGFCDENGEMVLVYDYMPLGTLKDHLYQTHTSRPEDKIDNIIYAPMPWKQRLLTCIGAARGLHYLHTGSDRVIIHRDVKSTNILLDKNWIAKVSDFGISKVGPYPIQGAPTYVSTLVKGSIGYLDPEYIRLKQLTEKSDVYSFGVVLFEVLCGRPAMMPLLVNEQVNLARYATRCYKEDTLHEIVDPNVRGEIAPVCLRKFGEIAEMCVRDQGSERPSMEDVVWYLEFALQLQKTAENNNDIIASTLNVDNDIGVTNDIEEIILSPQTSSSDPIITYTKLAYDRLSDCKTL